MFDFDDIKNDITSQSTNLEDMLVLNSFNPIVTFFNFYGEYLPYIKEETNYNDLIPGGIYKLDVVDFDNIPNLSYERYTVLPRMLNHYKYKSSLVNNKLFKTKTFNIANDIMYMDNAINILYNDIILRKHKDAYMVLVDYFDIFTIYRIYFNHCKITPVIYLSYRTDIEIPEILPYIYKAYDIIPYNKINNELKSVNFDYYNSYYMYIKGNSEELIFPGSSIFDDIRREATIYFKYNNEHYFIQKDSENNLRKLQNILLFDYKKENHNIDNNFTYSYIIYRDTAFSELQQVYVESPCVLPEFCKHIKEIPQLKDPIIVKVKI